jgi:hypothetical protein
MTDEALANGVTAIAVAPDPAADENAMFFVTLTATPAAQQRYTPQALHDLTAAVQDAARGWVRRLMGVAS